MKKILPITALRNTVEIEKTVNNSSDPIFISKNGHNSFVILNDKTYKKLMDKPISKISENNETNNEYININEQYDDESFGFARIKTVSIDISLGDIKTNKEKILIEIEKALKDKVHVISFQELTLTGVTCDDVFLNHIMINKSIKAVKEIIQYSIDKEIIISVGSPLRVEDELYNVLFIIFKGKILAIIPKENIPEHQRKYFKKAPKTNKKITVLNQEVIFGNKIILINNLLPEFRMSFEIGEDMLLAISPATRCSINSATIIINASGINETNIEGEIIRNQVLAESKRLQVGYVYASTYKGEDTSNYIYSGRHVACENGEVINENEPFTNGVNIVDIDVKKVSVLKTNDDPTNGMTYIGFDMKIRNPENIYREYERNPFLPKKLEKDPGFAAKTIKMQAFGLAERLRSINTNKVVLALSGGLDSTLALIVVVEAFDLLKLPRENIFAITMPAKATTSRTKNNAQDLAIRFGVTFKEINILASLKQHLKDIGHGDDENVAYENAQARERTQIAMDIANDIGGLMIGTGDLSELCLGWCTYNGDHMSMYSVNASIPKTMVKHLVLEYGRANEYVKEPLFDIADTPISPELKSSKNDQIAQLTEDIVGPYFLHDFTIYHFLKYHFSPSKIEFIENKVFRKDLSKEDIKKWLKVFFKRFFQNQFKRNCLPDGAAVSCVNISPKGVLSLPSTFSYKMFVEDLD